MEDADDRHGVGNDPVVDDVLPNLIRAEGGSDIVSGTANLGLALSVANAWLSSAR